jgi:transcriptional regulator with GAF, ATPase, and Fis domain
MAAQYRREGSVVWNRLEDLGELPQFQEHARQMGVLAGVFWAHRDRGSHVEGIAIGSPTPKVWPVDVEEQLGIVGDVLYNALYRLRAEVEVETLTVKIQTLNDRLESENIALKEGMTTSLVGDELVGKSHAFRTVLRQMEQVAGTDSTVLLLGETGTGKGLAARRIHEMSGRHEQPMVTVNCAALPAPLIESELFGHEKGAFTGATSRKIGRFELADGGTILLDEVGDLPLELQAKLLRVLQDRQFERLGSSTTLTMDTRVIAATNRDLDLLIAEQRFRSDLYYRLGVFPIRMPPLRERRADIALLVWFFVEGLQARLGKRFDSIPSDVMDRLVSHDWPGNVRELQNILERAMILAPGPELDFRGVLPIGGTENHALTEAPRKPGASLRDVERSHILAVLEECGWKVRGKGGAAERLGLNRSTLQSRMKKLALQRPTA